MRVKVDPSVFEQPGCTEMDRIQLLRMGTEGQHRVLVDDEAPGFQAWLDR